MNLFGKKHMVPRLCSRSGWLLVKREEDRHWVRSSDEKETRLVRVRNNGQFMKFVGELPVRFSLETPPSGLFARLLMRSIWLDFASWRMDIGDSCEAILYLAAQLPVAGMTPRLFAEVCREIRDELLDFHEELREKFQYGVVGGTAAGGQQGYGGVPALRSSGNMPDIRYFS